MRQNQVSDLYPGIVRERREWPVGSELMIAFALGAAGWWVIVRAVLWITAS